MSIFGVTSDFLPTITPIYLSGIIAYLISDPQVAYEWLAEQTVNRFNLSRTLQEVKDIVDKCGLSEMKQYWKEMTNSSLVKLVVSMTTEDGKSLIVKYELKETKTEFEYFILKLATFINNLTLQCLPPLIQPMSVENVYDILNKLIYNRENGFNFLIEKTVNVNRDKYTRQSIQAVLTNLGFDEYVYYYTYMRKTTDINIIKHALDSTINLSFDKKDEESVYMYVNTLYRFARCFLYNFLVFAN